jgi:hypothetical protein
VYIFLVGTSTPSQPQSQQMGVSPPSQPSSLDTQQMAYQQAFLQNAVAQNMQIQQQLMLQNQALTQLLSSSTTGKYFQFSTFLKQGLLEF